MSEILRSVVRGNEHGQSVIQFLTKRFTYLKKDEWLDLIGEERILVNHSTIVAEYCLKVGDLIEFHAGQLDGKEPSVDRNYRILYEDEWLFAVEKSGNIPVHPSGRYRKNALTIVIQEKYPESYIVHRLDRETSGIVLFSKDKQFTHKLSRLFEKHQIQKTYLVYVHGSFPEYLEAEGSIGPDHQSKIRKKKKFSNAVVEDGRYCKTNFKKITEKNGISYLYAIPQTGRIHQIRASLESLGYPVYGDKIYGGDENLFLDFIQYGNLIYQDRHIFGKGKPIIKRQALHAYRLEFFHPQTQERVDIICPQPKDMQEIFADGE